MRQFPVLHSSHREGEAEYIPWEILEPHEKQAYVNHMQSLEQLASRGGLSWREIYAVINDKEFDYGSNRTSNYYKRAVLDAVEKFELENKPNGEMNNGNGGRSKSADCESGLRQVWRGNYEV